MPLSFILRRMRRGWKVYAVLFVALLLATAFFSLAPIYLRAVGESALSFSVETAPSGQFDFTLRSASRMDAGDQQIIADQLGAFAAEIEQVTRSNTVFCAQQTESAASCTSFVGYIPIGFSRLEDRFTLVAGAWPNAGEAVITAFVAQEAELTIGQTLTLHGISAPFTLTVAGIVEPVEPQNGFWADHTPTLVGQLTDVTQDFQRYDIGVIVPEDDYDGRIAESAPVGTSYEWYVTTDPTQLRAATLDDTEARLQRVVEAMRLRYITLELLGQLQGAIDAFQADMMATEGPVVLLAAVVLLIILYQLATIGALIVEQQTNEWAAIASRGGSTLQLITLQGVSLAILGAGAFMIGPLAALGLLILIGRLGPSAQIFEGQTFDFALIPPSAYLLSLIAAAAAVALLTLPAWGAARLGLQRLKSLFARPAEQPVWARYYVDLALIALGVLLLLRLYLLVSGDADALGGLAALAQDPGRLVRAITSEAGRDANLLGDPFNIAAAGLIVTGLALLWMRLFPLIARAFSAITSRTNGLTAPLAIWNVERDPAHFAQLVILLIGTLALGTASLTLAATHEVGARGAARQTTGADVRVMFDPMQSLNALPLDSTYPDVQASAALMAHRVLYDGGTPFTAFGVDVDSMAALHPDWAAALEPLRETEIPLRSGQELPREATAISVYMAVELSEDIEAENAETVLAQTLELEVENAIGVRHVIDFSREAEPTSSGYTRHTAQLPVTGDVPWRLIGIRFPSPIASGTPGRTILMDNLTLTLADGSTQMLDDFERSSFPEWTMVSRNNMFVLPWRGDVFEGELGMRVDIANFPFGAQVEEPVLSLRRVISRGVSVPVILSEEARVQLEQRANRPLTPGETGTLMLNLPFGDREITFEIVGVVGSDRPFLTQAPRGAYLIADLDLLRLVFNDTATPDEYYTLNTVWADLRGDMPTDALRDEISSATGVLETTYAWDAYNAIRRDPLINALVGMLFAGFWVSLLLGLMDFAFYMAMTARRRATAFASLRAMGWGQQNIWSLLAVEQATFIIPALIIGVLIGGLLAYLLLPFFALIGGESLQLPLAQLIALPFSLIIAFTVVLAVTAAALQRMSLQQILRVADE